MEEVLLWLRGGHTLGHVLFWQVIVEGVQGGNHKVRMILLTVLFRADAMCHGDVERRSRNRNWEREQKLSPKPHHTAKKTENRKDV